MTMHSSWVLFLAAVAALAFWSCGDNGKYDDYCKRAMACLGGNADDEAACAAEVEGNEAKAKAYGCTTEFNQYNDCLMTNARCQTAPGMSIPLFGSMDAATGDDPCMNNWIDLSNCTKNASAINYW